MERKIKAGMGIGLPISVILIWIFGVIQPEITVPPEVATAFGAVMVTVFSYIVPNAKP